MHRFSGTYQLLFSAFLCLLSFSFLTKDKSFKAEQLRYERVRTAYKEKEATLTALLATKKIQPSSIELFLRVFKHERLLEVWGKEKKQEQFTLLKQYDFCETSGNLGPKRQMGDGQIPEGCYIIDRFNPVSNFHLSLGINYPNASDRILGAQGRLGNDIFIHGNCVTIGCIPITDDKIKEVYVLAVEAKSNGQAKIPVHIFPSRLNEQGLKTLTNNYRHNSTLIGFWRDLQPIYYAFESTHQAPGYRITTSGKYELVKAVLK